MVPAMVTPRPRSGRPRACVFNAVFGFCVVPPGRYVAVMAGGCRCATRREAQGAEHTSPEPTRGERAFYSVFLAFCPEREVGARVRSVARVVCKRCYTIEACLSGARTRHLALRIDPPPKTRRKSQAKSRVLKRLLRYRSKSVHERH